MKNALLKETFREIRRSKNRFLSIMAIIAVGTGFFAGVKSACPDMKLTARSYFEEQQLSDLRLISTYGFNEDDLAAIREDEGIKGVMPAYSADVLVSEDGESELTIRVLSDGGAAQGDDLLNRPVLTEGRMPEKSGECVAGVGGQLPDTWRIGTKIHLLDSGRDTLSDTMSATEYTIVGFVRTPQFFSASLGTTTVGDGKLDGYIFVPQEDFCLDVYTDIYLTLKDTAGLDPFQDEYPELVDAAAARFEQIADVRAEKRFAEIKADVQKELADAREKLADGKKELEDAGQEITDGEKELADGWKEYADAKETFEREISSAQRQLWDAEKQLQDGETEYRNGLQEYEDGLASYQEAQPAAEKQLSGYRQQAAELEAQLKESESALQSGRQLLEGIDGLLSAFAETALPDAALIPADARTVIDASAALHESLPSLLTSYLTQSGGKKEKAKAGITAITGPAATQLDESEALYNEGKAGLQQLRQGIADGEKKLADGAAELAAAKEELDAAREKLDRGRSELSQNESSFRDEKEEGRQKLDDAYRELHENQQKLDDAKKEFDDAYPDAAAEIADGEKRIADGEKELADLKAPEWYINTRDDNPGYSDYSGDTEKVDAVAAVFPVFFVLVAALVCLTAMTRMVEEQRTQIGTLKALGYGKNAIMSKYLLYAVSASILGSAIGLLAGFQLFPRIIIDAYISLYQMPPPLVPFRWDYALGCVLTAVLCTGLSALSVCYKALAAFPAKLMRPKSPKSGKRILLERVGFFWNRLNFTHKVTLRNIFRYKKRVMMTVIGVAGCSALILTGFGMRHAVTSISSKQYGEIFLYGGTAALDDQSADERDALTAFIREQPGVTGTLAAGQKSCTAGTEKYDCTAFVPSDPSAMEDFVHLQNRLSKEALILDDGGAIISEKLSTLTGVGAGDSIKVDTGNGTMVSVPVSGVAENYVMHFLYMTPTLYEQVFGEEYVPNTLLFNMDEEADQSRISAAVLEQDGVLAVLLSRDYSDSFTNLTGSMSLIVWVLIISAGALAVIVMYNLLSINVAERTRELATIKVLGFHDKEVSDYICRENTIASVAGMLLGLVLGVLLEKFVIQIAEVDMVMFAHDIPISSFVWAALLTLLFTWLVNFVVHFSLKKISMVESMKAVE